MKLKPLILNSIYVQWGRNELWSQDHGDKNRSQGNVHHMVQDASALSVELICIQVAFRCWSSKGADRSYDHMQNCKIQEQSWIGTVNNCDKPDRCSCWNSGICPSNTWKSVTWSFTTQVKIKHAGCIARWHFSKLDRHHAPLALRCLDPMEWYNTDLGSLLHHL